MFIPIIWPYVFFCYSNAKGSLKDLYECSFWSTFSISVGICGDKRLKVV